MPEDNPFIGGKEVPAVFQALSWSGALWVQRQNFRSDELAIEAISERVCADGGGY